MNESRSQIYVGRVPYSETGCFWVSFESDPHMIKTKRNIYNRCLPCIQNLYHQLKGERTEIDLGIAFNCWKITAVLKNMEECFALLYEFESKFPSKYVYGKLGSSKPYSETKVVVFHAENESECNEIKTALNHCLCLSGKRVLISKGCGNLHNDILDDWETWSPKTVIKYPEKKQTVLERIKKILYYQKF